MSASKPLPKIQATAPEQIHLCIGDDERCADEDFIEHRRMAADEEGVTWAENAATQITVPYVRADLATDGAIEPDEPSDAMIEAGVAAAAAWASSSDDPRGLVRAILTAARRVRLS